MVRHTLSRSFVIAALFASRVGAQEHQHPAATAEKLGTAHFATSCQPSVAAEFDRGVALLHSFEFGAAIRSFSAVLAADSTCTMAGWGLALSRWSNPMTAGIRTAAQLEPGRLAAANAERLAATATERERAYVAAVGELYADYERRDQRTRQVAYATAMADLAARQPADTEAQIFYALSLTASAPATDKTYANQLKAGKILEDIWTKQPNHPGLAHYIIHSYDVPALASRAALAAKRYADIAPSAAHALHMPSHTFTRVGMWQESVNTNLRSMEAASRESAIGEALHASDYAVYAYLQMRRDSAAAKILASLPALAKKFDANAITGAAPGSAGIFAQAAIPARYALERREWKEAAALVPRTTSIPYADALTYFARALGAAQVNELDAARASVDSLVAIRQRLLEKGEAYWAEQVAIQALGAQAFIELTDKASRSNALLHMREAALREDATEKSATTPGPLAPARELLGEMLLQLKRPADALLEFQRTLEREPNRYRSVLGAKEAAAVAGNRALESKYAAQLQRLTGQ